MPGPSFRTTAITCAFITPDPSHVRSVAEMVWMTGAGAGPEAVTEGAGEVCGVGLTAGDGEGAGEACGVGLTAGDGEGAEEAKAAPRPSPEALSQR